MDRIFLEVACFSPADAVTAARMGAHAIEFCSDYAQGGLFPGTEAIKKVKDQIQIPLRVMIRPRPGDFCYSNAELDTMVSQIRQARDNGADGLVFGILTNEGVIDEHACEQLLKEANNIPCTFHRAFDKTPDLNNSMEVLIALDFKRILTSGGKRHAMNGRFAIRDLNKSAAGKIEVVAGGGVRANNIKQLFKDTGTHFMHTAAWDATNEKLDVMDLRNMLSVQK